MKGEATPLGLARNERDTDPTGQTVVDEVAQGWLGDYVRYAGDMTDSPAIFHLAVGLSVLATACGSRVQFRGAGGKIFWPNLYVLFIAPSGLMRKSTSIEIGLNILRRADPDCISPNETSREEFLRVLSSRPELLVRESEFASALARYSRDYMGGSKELITDLYDNYPEYRRQIKGKEGTGEKLIIKRPALNYLAASTIEWLVDSLTVNDMRSGFMARFLIFPAMGKGRWVSFLSEYNEVEHEALAQRIVDIRRLADTNVDLSPIMKTFNAWIRPIESLADSASAETMGFYSRMALHCAKLTVLLTVSDCGPQRHYVATPSAFERASHLMEWLRDRYEELAERKLLFSKDERVMQGIMDQVRKDGKMEWSLALKRSHLKTQDFQRYLSTLLDRREVVLVTEQTKTRPAKVIHIPGANGNREAKVTEMAKQIGPNVTELRY